MITAAIIGATLVFLGLSFFAYVLYLTKGAELEHREELHKPRVR